MSFNLKKVKMKTLNGLNFYHITAFEKTLTELSENSLRSPFHYSFERRTLTEKVQVKQLGFNQ